MVYIHATLISHMYRSLPLHIRPKSVAVTNGVIVEEDYDAIWHDEKDYAKVCISSTFLKITGPFFD